MMYVSKNSVAAERGRRGSPLHLSARLAALALILIVPAAAAAADLDNSYLRGSYRDGAAPAYSRWDGWNFGVQGGASNMNTDYSNATSDMVAFLLTNTTLEKEAHPSKWPLMPSSSSTRGGTFGGFIGYNYQWDELVVGVDAAYNRMSSLASSARGSIARVVGTSDGYSNTVAIAGTAALRLVDYATLRARAGYAVGQFLPYAFVGGAVGRFNYSRAVALEASGVDTSGKGGSPYDTGVLLASDAKDGAIVGGVTTGLGMDMTLLPNLFVRAEWEFVAFAQFGGMRANINSGRVGVGLKF